MDGTLVGTSAVVGFFLSAALQKVKQQRWSHDTTVSVVFACCLAASLAELALAGGLGSWGDWASTLPVVLGSAIATYHAVWRDAGAAKTDARA